MKRTSMWVAVILAVGLFAGCNKSSVPPSVVVTQSRPETTAAVEPVSDRAAARTDEGTVSPEPPPELKGTCEALEKRAPEIDRGYTMSLSDGIMAPESDHVNKGAKIERRGYADEEYRALKECLRNSDDNLKLEKPLLSFGAYVIVQGLRFGMTRQEVEQPRHVLFGSWRIDGCKQTNFGDKTAYQCTYWHDNYIEGLGLDRAHSALILMAYFDANDRVVAWEYMKWFPTKFWKSASDIVREERDPNGGDVAGLGIPDTENEGSASWTFYSRSEKDRFGMPKPLESVHLEVLRQSIYWAISVTYTDDENKS